MPATRPAKRAAEKPASEIGERDDRREAECHREDAAEYFVNAEDLVERRGQERHDLELQLDVIRGRPVVERLRIHDVEPKPREVARDRRSVALAPGRMVEDWIANAVESQRQRKKQHCPQCDRPAVGPQLRWRNVQYLLRKKFTKTA